MHAVQPSQNQSNDAILRELHHRFYNSLQVISAMASALGRDDGRTALQRRQTLERFQNRIALLADINRRLAEPLTDPANAGANCRRICRNLAKAFDKPCARMRFRLAAFPRDPDLARGLLLLIVELVTNALKHGSPADGPSLTVELAQRSDHLQLAVENSVCATGIRPPDASRPRVAAQLVNSLGGSLSVSTGASFRVSVSLPTGRGHVEL